jgi:predicted secreted Zn-dependent protease
LCAEAVEAIYKATEVLEVTLDPKCDTIYKATEVLEVTLDPKCDGDVGGGGGRETVT